MKLRIVLLVSSLLTACASAPQKVSPCERYCSTYEEGYQWAGASNLHDERSCLGYTSAFGNGCRQQISDRLLSLAPGREGL